MFSKGELALGCHPGYSFSIFTLAPANKNTLSTCEQTQAFRLSDELRIKSFTSVFSGEECTIARFKELSTVSGKSANMLITPFGHPSTAFIKSSCTSSGISVLGISVFSALKLIDSSIPANSTLKSFSYSFTKSSKSSTNCSGIVTTANDSRGIALRKVPPFTLAKRAS